MLFTFDIPVHENTCQEFLMNRHYALVIKSGLLLNQNNPNFPYVGP